MLGENDTVDLLSLEFVGNGRRIITKNNRGYGLVEFLSSTLGKYQKLIRDRPEFSVFVFRYYENHKTFASLRSFSTSFAAASSGEPVRISTRLFLSGIKISFTSYMAPGRP